MVEHDGGQAGSPEQAPEGLKQTPILRSGQQVRWHRSPVDQNHTRRGMYRFFRDWAVKIELPRLAVTTLKSDVRSFGDLVHARHTIVNVRLGYHFHPVGIFTFRLCWLHAVYDSALGPERHRPAVTAFWKLKAGLRTRCG